MRHPGRDAGRLDLDLIDGEVEPPAAPPVTAVAADADESVGLLLA